MTTEKILIIVLVVLAVGGLAWSMGSFFSNKEPVLLVENLQKNFDKAVQAEQPDKCKAPEGYTNEQWREHMSHHSVRYMECFTSEEQKNMIDPSASLRASYKNIGPDDLATMLKVKDFELIDVHIPEQAHIPGTDQFIPFDEIVDHQANFPEDKDAKIVLYCRSGNMSRTAAESLLELGYTNIYNLVGGINAWQQMGYGVENVSL
jgi:rhodanese-related sulfurtransferase